MKVTVGLLAIILVGWRFGATVSPLANDLAASSGNQITLRIVNGSETTIEQFPWIVAMLLFGRDQCAASIISPTRFVSAAHCTVNNPINGFELRAGSSFKRWGGQVVQVSNIIIHPEYKMGTSENNDISILWSQTPLNMASPGVSTIGLPDQSFSAPAGTLALVAGWGLLCHGCPSSPILNYVVVPIVSNAQCKSILGNQITDGMICAGYPDGGGNACRGDSGGPLTIGNTLVGIVSWGTECGRPGVPVMYTRVAFYRDWIYSNTKQTKPVL